MGSMQMAAVYNRLTGANITHEDVDNWGITTQTVIMSAFKLWDLEI